MKSSEKLTGAELRIHTYLGYAIKIVGTIDANERAFSIGIGKAAHAKHQFKVNDIISGECLPVPDPDMEPVDYYKVSKLAKVAEGEQGSLSVPWELVPPELEVYRDLFYFLMLVRGQPLNLFIPQTY